MKKFLLAYIFSLIAVFGYSTQYEYNIPTGGSTYFDGGTEKLGQTFTVGTVSTNQSFVLDSLRVSVNRMANYIVKFEIYAVSGGLPTGSILSSGEIPADGGNITNRMVEMTPVALSASTQYALVIYSANSYTNLLYAEYSTSNNYTGGISLQYVGSTWSEHSINWDLGFYLYGKHTPIITSQPTSITRCPGTSATFTVGVDSDAPTYQWRKGGSNISGATSASYTIASVTTGSAGSYDCVVTESLLGTTTTSSTATLTVPTTTSITSQPVSISRCVGTSATFSVTAAGTSLTYQWKKNGTNITGATSTSYTISSVATGDAANYTVTVTGTCGTVTSSTAVLTVNTSPSITDQPDNLILCTGDTATFSVTATGTGLTYQWIKDDINIAGATSASYTINNVDASDEGSYRCLITGTCANITSDIVTLLVGTEGEVFNTGLLNPSSTGYYYNEWTNPINAYLSDNIRTSTIYTDYPDDQDYYNFNIDIPVGATIVGIVVSSEIYTNDAAPAMARLNFELSSNSGISYTTSGKYVINTVSYTDQILTCGGSSDTWGRTWSASDFNNDNFILKATFVDNGYSAWYSYCDNIQVNVYYTICSAPEIPSTYLRKKIILSSKPRDILLSGKKRDFGISSIPTSSDSINLVWYDDFENWTVDYFPGDTMVKKYQVSWYNWIDEYHNQIVNVGSTHNKVWRSDYPSGTVGASSGFSFGIPLGNKYEEIWLSQDVYLNSGFDYYNNSLSNGGGKVLPGFAGGGYTPIPYCNDTTFIGWMLHGIFVPLSGGSSATLSTYMYYQNMWGEAECPSGTPGDCGTATNCYGVQDYLGVWQTGAWHNYKVRIVMNTIVGGVVQNDGYVETFWDNTFETRRTGLRFLTNSGTTNLIDQIFQGYWFGGSAPSDAATWLMYDNIVAYTIGPKHPDYRTGPSSASTSNIVVSGHKYADEFYTDQTYTATSGSIYSHDKTKVENDPGMLVGETVNYTITPTGATTIHITFPTWEIEKDLYDPWEAWVRVYNSSNTLLYTFNRSTIPSGTYNIASTSVRIEYYAGRGYNQGFELSYTIN